jgi:hypothetical protein
MNEFVLMVTVVCQLTIPTCQLITRLTKQGKTLLKYPKTTNQLHLSLNTSDKTTTQFHSSTTVINPKVNKNIPEKEDMSNFFLKNKLKILNKPKIDRYNLRIVFVAEESWTAVCKEHFLLQAITRVHKQAVHT